MNWYKTIKIAASPKNLVNQWKIDDPFQKFFIYTYEPKLAGKNIKTKDDLNAFIKSELIPELKAKIQRGNPEGYYKTELSPEEVQAEILEHENDPRVRHIVKQYKANPTSDYAKNVERQLIDVINEDKQTSFDKWWKFMSSGHGDNPAFFYSMLNPIIESSPAKQKNGVPPASKKAINLIKDEIGTKGVTQMNIYKKFVKSSYDLDLESSEVINLDQEGNQINRSNEKYQHLSDDELAKLAKNSKKSWIKIDSKLINPEDYNDNQEKLMRFATDSGWCIARNHYSDKYLKQGDFWLYFENKRPKTAIRLEGNSEKGQNKVAEIRGRYNQRDTLEPYWEQVTTFLHGTDFNYTGNEHYQILRDIMEKNVNLKELEATNPSRFKQMYDSFKKSIEKDPRQLGQISDVNKANYPEFIDVAARGYERKLNKLLDNVSNPKVTGGYQKKFSSFQDYLDDVPSEVKPKLSGEIQGRLVGVHKEAFAKNPTEFDFFPEDMQNAIEADTALFTKVWEDYIGKDPFRYHDLVSRWIEGNKQGDEAKSKQINNIFKAVPLRPIVGAWDKLVVQNIDYIDNIPPYILKHLLSLDPNYKSNKIIDDFKRFPCNRTSQGFDKLQRIQENNLMNENEISQVYADFVEKNQNNKYMRNPITLVPNKYREIITRGFTPSATPEDMPIQEENAPSASVGIHSIAIRYYRQVIENPKTFNSINNDEVKTILVNDPKYSNGIRNAFENMRSRYPNIDGFWASVPAEVKPIMTDETKELVASYWTPIVQRNNAYLNQLDDIIKEKVGNRLRGQPPQNPPTIESLTGNWYRKVLS